MEDNRILSWVTRVEEDIRNDFYDQYPVIEETGVTEKIEQLFSETKESVLGKIEQDDPYAKQKKQINELKDFLESEKDLTDIDQYVDEYCKCRNDDFGVWKKTLSDIKNKKTKITRKSKHSVGLLFTNGNDMWIRSLSGGLLCKSKSIDGIYWKRLVAG